jgi:hypothetical protein
LLPRVPFASCGTVPAFAAALVQLHIVAVAVDAARVLAD